MARATGGLRWCSSRTTLVVCCLNLVAAAYVFRSLYSSYYIFSSSAFAVPAPLVQNYTDEQIKMMKESIRIRKQAKPVQLVKLVKKLQARISRGERDWELSQPMKQKLAHEILQRLEQLGAEASVADHQETLQNWRMIKLQEVKRLTSGDDTSNPAITSQEAKMLQRALETDWLMFLEDLGLWIPVPVIHKMANETEEPEEEIIAGPPIPADCHAEFHTDYGGAAVRWGLKHHTDSAADCCRACLDQARRAGPGQMKCNIWVYCPSETGCHSPDKYVHRHQECWLKQDATPKLSFKDKYSEQYRNIHPDAPLIVPWMAGIVG